MTSNERHNTLNSRQEKFCLNYFSGMSAYQAAIEAGYAKNTALVGTKRLLDNVRISARLQELRDKAEDEAVMTQKEMLKKLTSIARAKMSDFMTCSADGTWLPDYGPDSMNSEAVKQIQTTTMPFKEGEDPI